jgi:hypothetical protein
LSLEPINPYGNIWLTNFQIKFLSVAKVSSDVF